MTAKYELIYNRLKLAILRGQYSSNALLPSEKALAIHYHVSRITSKRALNELVKSDLIYRVQGKGSFVKEHAPSGGGRTILLVLPFGADKRFGDYATGIIQSLAGTSWALATMTNQEFTKLSDSELHYQYAGLFYYPKNRVNDIPRLLNLYQLGLPMVLLNEQPGALAIPSVSSDNISGGALAVRHLIALGHQRIAFFSSLPFWHDFSGTISDRFFGYANVYEKQFNTGAPLRWAKTLASKTTASAQAAYIKSEHITAVIRGNDLEALNFCKALTNLGWQLPKDLSVVGFDNLPASAESVLPLTTLGQDFQEIGRRAVDLLLQQLNDPQKILATRALVPVQLVERRSTGPAPKTQK